MASYGTGSATETSFVIYIHGFTGDKSRFMQILVDDTVKFSGRIDTAWESDPYNGQMTVTGLSPCTTYTIKVYIGSSTVYSNNDLMYTGYATTAGCSGGGDDDIPDVFYWIDSRTDLEPGMVISQYITAKKWTELQNNVNAVLVYMGYSRRNFTPVSRGQRITATLYNELRTAINNMVRDMDDDDLDTIPSVSSGSPITAECMMLLQDTINEIG